MPRAVTLAGVAGSLCALADTASRPAAAKKVARALIPPSSQLQAPGSQHCVDVAGAALWLSALESSQQSVPPTPPAARGPLWGCAGRFSPIRTPIGPKSILQSLVSTVQLCPLLCGQGPFPGTDRTHCARLSQSPADTQACAHWAAVLSVSVVMGTEASCRTPAPGPLVCTARGVAGSCGAPCAFWLPLLCPTPAVTLYLRSHL